MPLPATRPHVRHVSHRLGLVLAAGLAIVSLGSCASGNQSTGASDKPSTDASNSQSTDAAYKIGCPAVDAAAAGGTTLNQAAIKALETARDSGQLDPEPTKWVNTAIDVLSGSDNGKISKEAKKTLIDDCAKHGYPLKNLS